MAGEGKERKIDWYRSPVERAALIDRNEKSDLKGWLQTASFLSLLALTAWTTWYAAGHLPWPVALVLLFIHGTFFAFLLNAFHEFCHKSVFRTKALNVIFLQVVSFLSWSNPVLFWTSHQEHHKFTLHPPEDLEVVLPQKLTFIAFAKSAVVNPWELYARLKLSIRLSFGRLEGDWENHIFPDTALALRSSLFSWSRYLLLGQALIVAVSLYFHLWMLPVIITLAPFYGGCLQYLCNNTQHTGLMDNVPDFRLCCRTILLNPFVRFLYWHMNFHTEHHMYAAVPCYNLGKLHRQIEANLPHCPAGLLETWREIMVILKIQKTDPAYQYRAELPSNPS